MNKYILLFLALLSFHCGNAQFNPGWRITSKTSIQWDLNESDTIQHADNIELAGKKVAGIVSYKIDKEQNLEIERQVFFPQIHPLIKDTDPDWYVYRAYAKPIFKDDVLPGIYINSRQITAGKLNSVTIDGKISFDHHPNSHGVKFHRSFYPSMNNAEFNERITLTNTTDTLITFQSTGTMFVKEGMSRNGGYAVIISPDVKQEFTLAPDSSYSYLVQIGAMSTSRPSEMSKDGLERDSFLRLMAESLILETPNDTLNTLFEFSKIRASESIFESQLGLIHSPGGGRYYVGIWANDQAEYVSPFFPYLGYEIGNQSAMNTYRAFSGEMNQEYKPIRYAFEIEGQVPPFLLDRGDAAMIAYGAGQYALAQGSFEEAEELWPLITWCLEYCHRKLNAAGVVVSESDEMEGRIETGDANLSTSSLYYGALEQAYDLGQALGKKDLRKFQQRRLALGKAIEGFFGANVEGLDTYRYYDGHTKLRHWICLPLVVGINTRKDATIKGLFERLWTENGVHVEKNSPNPQVSNIFWDRGTLYALRGTFLSGATEVSLEKLEEFSAKRLLGSRVPYVVEAYPEGSMAHLSAESGLYCRVFIEGMFGIKPTSLSSFTMIPRLPKGWDKGEEVTVRFN